MCRLMGIAGDLRFQDEFTMQRLLLTGYFGGSDATGMAAVRTNNDVVIAKLPSNPIDLFHDSRFKAALNGNTSKVFLGHTRLKTRGENVTANAHPFHVDHIVGAHNGTLEYSSWRALEKELNEEFAVDSLALITAIAKLGIEETMKLCEEGKDYQTGAWAITWVDQNEGTLNFLRNKHRSLFHACEKPKEKKDKGFQRMFWSTEWWMMREAIESSGKGYSIFTNKDNIGFFAFTPDTWYKYDLDELCAEKTKPIKPKIKEVKGTFVPPKPVYTGNYGGYGSKRDDPFGRQSSCGFQLTQEEGTNGTRITTVGTPNSHQRTGSQTANNTNHTSTTTSRGLKDKKKTVLQLVGGTESPYAGIITEDTFNPMAEKGCFFCEETVSYGDPGVTIFERDNAVLCRKCSDHPDEAENPPVKIYVRASAFDAIAN